MNTLPDATGKFTNPTPPVGTPQTGSDIGGKEKEGIGFSSQELPIQDVGKEMDLPKELEAIGVHQPPTVVPIPQPVSAMGVKPAGQNVAAAAPAVTLPLSDDQIALGLKQSIWTSWRWLAQWCIRKLKQVHMGLKHIHGRLTRVRQ